MHDNFKNEAQRRGFVDVELIELVQDSFDTGRL
jgi:hypothetical protein